jgi:hypothetical protein
MRRGNLASTQNSQLCAHLDHVIYTATAVHNGGLASVHPDLILLPSVIASSGAAGGSPPPRYGARVDDGSGHPGRRRQDHHRQGWETYLGRLGVRIQGGDSGRDPNS